MTKKKQSWLVAAIVLIALVLDQVSKVYVKTHFDYGEAHEVFSWFWITFIENPFLHKYQSAHLMQHRKSRHNVKLYHK